MTIAIDSSVLIAYVNKDDGNHHSALQLFKEIEKSEYGQPVILDYVFDEVVTYFSSKHGKKLALSTGQWMFSSDFELHYISHSVFQEAWNIFQKSSDLSFTDCVIAVFARESNSSIATFDGHFSQFKDLRIIS